MKKQYISLTLLVTLLCYSKAAVAFLPRSYSLYELIEESEMVAVVKVVGVRKGEPPLLEVELQKFYKGEYKAADGNPNNRIYLNLRGTVSHFNLVDPWGLSLLKKFPPGTLHIAFVKQAPTGMIQGQQVMKPVTWTWQALLPMPDILNTVSPRADFYHFPVTPDYLSAVERLGEIDALPDREQKIISLNRIKEAASAEVAPAIDNPHLLRAVEDWLFSIERQIEREKASTTPPKAGETAG